LSPNSPTRRPATFYYLARRLSPLPPLAVVIADADASIYPYPHPQSQA